MSGERVRATQAEFARQADAMSRAPAFCASEITEGVAALLGARARGRVLDLACGPGILSARIAGDADSLIALDLTPRMLDRARSRCVDAGVAAHFAVGSAEQLPLPDGCVDAVVTRLSIHHFDEPARVLREARRVLRPDGRLALADVVASEDPGEAALHNAIERLRDPSHVRMLAESELLRELADAGFEPVSHSRWRQARGFEEWAAVVEDARALEPLRVVLNALARAGVRAGIELSSDGSGLGFVHRWLLVAAAPRGE